MQVIATINSSVNKYLKLLQLPLQMYRTNVCVKTCIGSLSNGQNLQFSLMIVIKLTLKLLAMEKYFLLRLHA